MYCSRYLALTIAARKVRDPRFSVYQDGRGSEPTIAVGSMMLAVARSILVPPSRSQPARHRWCRRIRPAPPLQMLVGSSMTFLVYSRSTGRVGEEAEASPASEPAP